MSQSDNESQFTPAKPSKSQKRSKSEQPSSKKQKLEPSKGRKGKEAKDKKLKPAKIVQKQAKKKKQKSKEKYEEGDVKGIVFQYMQKQNRPYNLLNIFDNLHGKIKKGVLQPVLAQLAEEEQLTCKEFGKNKVYFLNQSMLNVSKENTDNLALEYNELREKEKELGIQHKTKLQELKKLLSRKTYDEIVEEVQRTKENIQILQAKKDKLTSIDAQKIDEEEVNQIEKQEGKLRKELNKRRKLTKQCLKIWSQILQKKVPQVAQMMGVEL